MKTKSSFGLLKAAAAFVLIAGASGCQQPTQVTAKSATPVRVVDVALHSSTESQRYSASVLPLAQATLSFKSAGYVTEIRQVLGADGRRREIGAGDYVSRGALLAKIRHQDLKNQLDQTAAGVTQAEAQNLQASLDYERAKALYSTHSLTKPDFDQAQARFDASRGAVDQAKASLRQSQLALADADLRRAFFGLHPGSQYRAGKSGGARSCGLHDCGHQRGESELRRPGVRGQAAAPGPGMQHSPARRPETIQRQGNQHCRGRRREKSGVRCGSDRAQSQELFRAGHDCFPQPRRCGKRAGAFHTSGGRCCCPGAPGRYGVFVASEGNGKWTAHLQAVTLGETHDSDVAVEGVKPGEKIVVVGAANLKDGDLVQVLR